MAEKTFSISEVCSITGLSAVTVYRYLRTPKGQKYLVPGSNPRRMTMTGLNRFLGYLVRRHVTAMLNERWPEDRAA